MTVPVADYLQRHRLPEPLRTALETERRKLARMNPDGLGEDALRLRAWQRVVGGAS